MERRLRVIGIDPGLSRLGYGIVEQSRSRLACLSTGTIETSQGPLPGRLRQIFSRLSDLIEQWSPGAMAVERVFLKLNLKTGVPAIQAGGIALLAGAIAGLEVHEYSPAEVKHSLTGVGNAGKDQVQFMVKSLLAGDVIPDSPDAADAVALAITHIHNGTVFRQLSAGTRRGAVRAGDFPQ